LEVSEAQELRSLRDENGRLKKLVADLSLDCTSSDKVGQKVARNKVVFLAPWG
jgi:hypothetical protein